MPRIEDNRATETISFNGSGSQQVLSWNLSPFSQAAGLLTVYTVARRSDGAVFIDTRRINFIRRTSSLSLGAAAINPSPLLGDILSGVDVDVSSSGTAVVASVNVALLAAGEWVVTTTMEVEAQTF